MKTLLKPFKWVVIFIAVLAVFFEEWLCENILKFVNMVAVLPVIKQIGYLMDNIQNKYVAFSLFTLLELVFLPSTFFIEHLVSNGHIFSSLVVFALAKILGTTIFVWMCKHLGAQVMQIYVVNFLVNFINLMRNRAHEWIQHQPIYIIAKEKLVELRRRKEHWLKRRFRAAKVFVKK